MNKPIKTIAIRIYEDETSLINILNKQETTSSGYFKKAAFFYEENKDQSYKIAKLEEKQNEKNRNQLEKVAEIENAIKDINEKLDKIISLITSADISLSKDKDPKPEEYRESKDEESKNDLKTNLDTSQVISADVMHGFLSDFLDS